MRATALDRLHNWLKRQLDPAQLAWLDEALANLRDGPTIRDVQIAIGMAPRKLGRVDLELTKADFDDANEARQGWNPERLSVDAAARILLLATAAPRLNNFPERFADLCRYGDVAEQIACYSALPLLPSPKSLEPQVGEGLRTHMRAVFEAIAHDNPYPSEQFDDHRWNHMVLKALFVGSRLSPIVGLDARANAELARILCDYAHERWAAGRSVTPELWRCVGPFATGAMVDDLARALNSADGFGPKGAALALAACADPKAADVLAGSSRLADDVRSGRLTWNSLAAEMIQIA